MTFLQLLISFISIEKKFSTENINHEEKKILLTNPLHGVREIISGKKLHLFMFMKPENQTFNIKTITETDNDILLHLFKGFDKILKSCNKKEDSYIILFPKIVFEGEEEIPNDINQLKEALMSDTLIVNCSNANLKYFGIPLSLYNSFFSMMFLIVIILYAYKEKNKKT